MQTSFLKDSTTRSRVDIWRVFLLGIVLFVGSSSAKLANATENHTLSIAISAPVGALNPHGYGTNAMFAQNLVYEGLTKLDKSGNIIPSLATSWDISPDGRSYTFHLRKGVRFSNGEIFDADVVLLNFTSILQHRERHSWVGLIHALDSIKKLDPYTIVLTLKYPYTLTLDELAFVRPFRFLAKSAFPSDLNLTTYNPTPIGTGAYMLESSSASTITFRKNPYYKDFSSSQSQAPKTPYFDTIIAKIIFEPSARLAALQARQIDAIYGLELVSLDMFNTARKNPRLRTYTSAPLSTILLAINPRTKALESTFARKALVQALDTSALIPSVFGDLAMQATSIYAPNTALLQSVRFPKLPPHQCDMAHTPKDPIELIYPSNNPQQKMLAQIIQSQAKACGIPLRIKGIEPSAYKKHLINNTFELAFTQTWGAPYEPLSHLYSMQKEGHIEYKLLQALESTHAQDFHKHTTQAIHTSTTKELQDHLNTALSLLFDAYILFPIAHQRNAAIVRSEIKGVEMGALVVELPIAEWYQ
ncbi:ABC transporter substrate-binding protein [Helicobacter canis]|uniref:Nickel transport system periplasmic component n=1 Tax=Helicobacter canis TaxID=29419 RepID=A0A377J324_9HELI|nr:ABC transporter substrate-binding protein [Helicobacter canis]STO96729.1 nickel transport system periplasmic component [Helicobacter canis]